MTYDDYTAAMDSAADAEERAALAAEAEAEIAHLAGEVYDDAADFASLCRSLGLDAPDPREEAARFELGERWTRGLLPREEYPEDWG